jgi:hypothetical protein
MNRITKLGWMLAVLMWVTGASMADKAGVKVGEFQAGGDAKEMAVNQQVSKVIIKCTDGSVIINTVVVRDGGNKTPHSVGARLNKGDTQQISVGDKVNCSGLRISDAGTGTYVVRVKK